MREGLRRLLEEVGTPAGARQAVDLALIAAEEVLGPSVVGVVGLRGAQVRSSGGVEAPTEAELQRVTAEPAVEDGNAELTAGSARLVAALSPIADGLVALVASADRDALDEHAPVILSALARATLLSQNRRRAAEVERLNVTAQRVATFLDPEHVLSEIVRDAVELVGADSGDLVLRDPEDGVMRVVAVANLPASMVGFELDPDEGVSPRAMAARRTIIVADYRQYRHRVRRLDAYGFRAIVSAPLIARTEPIGVLNVHTTSGKHRFTREDARLLTTFANHAAIAIDNARRYENESRLARDLARVNDDLQRSLSLQQRLTEQVLLDRGPAAVVAELAGLLGRPVVLQDRFFGVIAGAAPGGGGGWEGLAIPREAGSDPTVAAFLRELAEAARPVEAPELGMGGPPRVVVPLRVGAGVSGYLVAESGRLEPLDRVLIEIASTSVALELAKLQTKVEVENRIRGEVLTDLLTGSFSSSEAIAARASPLGYDLSEPRDLVVLAVDDDETASDRPVTGGLVADRIEAIVAETSSGSIVVRHGGFVIVLTGNGAGEHPSLQPFVELLRSRVERSLPGAVISAAIGERCSGPDQYPPSYQLARDALQAVRALGHRGRVVDARQLGVTRLLLRATSPQEVEAFAGRLLDPLLRGSSQSQQLLATLRTYVEVGFNQRETARRSFVHINTVAYRLRRIEELLGVDLKDAEALMDLTFALRAADLLGMVQGDKN